MNYAAPITPGDQARAHAEKARRVADSYRQAADVQIAQAHALEHYANSLVIEAEEFDKHQPKITLGDVENAASWEPATEEAPTRRAHRLEGLRFESMTGAPVRCSFCAAAVDGDDRDTHHAFHILEESS
jgi:hypothetical protein